MSHAGLHVEHNGCSVVMDPWLVGSCYWRSWWNFPEVAVDPASLTPDYIYLTHIHWDHFHGPSLKKFSRKTVILIPWDRYDRMKRDLNAMGFGNVKEIPDGIPYRLAEDLYLTPYLFGIFTDSTAVLSSRLLTLLNANDCKILGQPLKRLLQDHPKIDFAFRSHSTANARLCHEYLDAPNEKLDDRERYMSSFCHFMKAVQPAYAVPFASNHCHLHKDTFRFNEWIVSPIDVKNYYDKYRLSHHLATELKIMLPGSRWDEERGFDLVDPAPFFDDRPNRIKDYRERRSNTLAAYYAKEKAMRVTTKEMEKFFLPLLEQLNWLLRLPFRGKPVYLKSNGPDGGRSWKVDLWRKTVAECDETEFANGKMQLLFPPIVLLWSLKLNMFSHAGISKRARYKADRRHMKFLILFELYLKLREYDYLPLRSLLSSRSLACWVRRWRELLVFGRVLYLRFVKKRSMVDIEQLLLAVRQG
ncbi:MAG TPA: hypothetical protein VLY45_05340 [Nitrospiria bacterium]|nr:hypothetical protein [Nitrospiria bacterium]